MRKSGVLFYVAVLVISLGSAYYTWTGGKVEKKPGNKVTVLDCAARELTSLIIQTKNRTVAYTPKKDLVSGDSYWWVNITSKLPASGARPEKDAAKEKTPEEPAAKEGSQGEQGDSTSKDPSTKEEKTRVEVFKGNKGLAEQMEKLCPLEALRSFGALDEGKLKEFGIAGSEERVVIGLKDGPREFAFGTTTYGHRDKYLQDVKTKEVYLVAGQLIQDLTYPKSRFMERALHQFEKDAIVRLQLSTGEAHKELLHRKQEDQKKDLWTDSKAPDKENELYANWVNKLWHLSPIDFLPVPETEAKGCPFPPEAVYVCSLLFFSEAKEIGFMKIYKGKDEKGEPEYYACTENTGAVVKLSKSQAENFIKDLEDVMGKG